MQIFEFRERLARVEFSVLIFIGERADAVVMVGQQAERGNLVRTYLLKSGRLQFAVFGSSPCQRISRRAGISQVGNPDRNRPMLLHRDDLALQSQEGTGAKNQTTANCNDQSLQSRPARVP